MSRITKWKLEKTKVKVVFRLQFHATHIPLVGWDKLFISFIPADSGKVTSKTTKASVRNGTCKWADPIYETTRLLQDIKTKQYDEKLYKLVIAMGSSRSSILGEATINLAHYADALKPFVIALPLHGCDSGTILHVTVQLLTSKTGFREFEQQRELRERGLQTDQHSPDESSGRKVSSSVETITEQIDKDHKAHTRVKFREKSKDLSSLEEEVVPTDEYADSGVGFDGSSNTSESLYAEKHETSSTHEIDSLRSTVSGDLAGISPSQSPQLEKGDPPDNRFSVQGTNDWVQGWSSDYSVDNDLAAAYEENSRLRGSLEAAESSIHELKMEVSSLQNHADEIGHEAQKFAKELAAEIASGEDLVNEVSVLKSECSKLKDDLEQLKISKLCPSFIDREAFGAEQDQISLRWLKGLLAMEDKIRELQNKACLGYNERDLRIFQSDIEALLDVLQNLKQGSGLTVSSPNLILSEGASLKEIREMSPYKNGQFATGTGFDVDLYQPEGMLHCLNIPNLISHESDTVDTTNAMKNKIFELLRELDDSKAERESLAKKMDQMECYYEALVQELEENQRQLLQELQNLRNEHSTCLYAISSTKADMESMHQGLNEQILRLAGDKHDMESFNKELERRALTAEAALKRARLNYSIAVDQLQKDLELLSFQVLSMYESNENLIRQAFVDSSPPNSRGCDSGEYAVKLLQFENQSAGIRKQQLGGDIHLDELKRSLHLQEGLYRKVEEEVCEMHFVNIYLDVLSKALQETLVGACEDVQHLKEKVNELTQQLELLGNSKQLLIQKLQIAMDEVHSLNEYKAACIAKCNDMALENQTLGADLQNMSHENHLLMQKIAEWKSMVIEYRGYEEKLEAYAAENGELTCLLEKKTLEIGILQNENISLQDELKTIKIEFAELASGNENLQNFVNSLQNKLQNLLLSYDKSIIEIHLVSESSSQDLQNKDLPGLLMQLEELQHNACNKILQLVEEKKYLMHEKDVAQLSITAAESDTASMKWKFEHEIRNMVEKLDKSNVLLQKLQLDVEAFANRLGVSSELEEKYAQQQNELFSGIDQLEVELQELTSKNRDLANEIIALETGTAAELTKENQALTVYLQDKNEESSKLSSELKSLKESLQSLYDENMALIASSHDKMEKSAQLASEVDGLKSSLQSLRDENQALMVASQDKAAEAAKLELELNSLKGNLQSVNDENQALMVISRDKTEECAKLASELNNLKESLQSLHDDKKALVLDKKDESAQFAGELNCLRESLQSLHNQLHGERSLREGLESKVTDQISKLNEKEYQVLRLNKSVSDLESENLRVCSLLSHYEDSLKIAREECSSIPDLKIELCKMDELLIATDVSLIFTKTQYENKAAELVLQLRASDTYLDELQKKHIEVETTLNRCLANEAEYTEENAKLLASLNSMRSELEASIAENRLLVEANRVTTAELEEYKDWARDVRLNCEDQRQHSLVVERLKHLLVSSEEEIDNLVLSKEELEVKVLVLKAKLDEEQAQITTMERYLDELMILKKQYNELSQRLADQILKTEEFRNLSIHLKELKDKAEAECVHAREKKDTEAPVAMQESLRIAFIKEQYETRLQELKQQLSISKKHSEEMLWKLQDAIDENDNMKKSEACHLKKNEELGVKILELEAELQAVLSDKRERMNAYDLMKAEMECSLISLECCKEEKQKLEASLQECNEEKSKLAVEIAQMKELLENSKSARNIKEKGNCESCRVDSIFSDICDKNQKILKFLPPCTVILNTLKGFVSKYLFALHGQDALLSSGVNGVQSSMLLNDERFLHSDMKQLALINDHFRAENLKSSMDHLNNELERMKNENSLLQNDHYFDKKFPALQSEFMQLQKANEELGSMFPLFNEFSGSGNALERVLALEIELAEALQAKKISSIHFQSSFLKQHSDEAAVFKSFRDINELIKDMLELKGRYVAVETELKEMHERYSELSLHFAEVEGERQKLMMTLKNVRASKKALHLNRSSSASLGDHS
ncbi:ATP binding protein, putative [Ricinus communis]|uniref:ATP binding protein, putative n=1 Tax=Ricinus communis TaxID=3988 RepID=B9RJE4_RICCO|nr:ATP binding protein, putative [Ricinus communis]